LPAFNEEEAIGDTIARCLEVRERISQTGGLAHVDITVVSDGSTDRTVEIAKSFHEVRVIVFERNRGYGAAIKEGWRHSKGTLVGCLDADGTCDPADFGEMCRIAIAETADLVVGSRLGPNSEMPIVRRLGNRLYAFLLGWLSGRKVTDTASGIRVVQRQSLKYLYPLPDGLHFTPSMSARALLNDLRVVEVPVQYKKRLGSSKLRLFRDGIRFLHSIGVSVLCYRSEGVFLLAFVMCLLLLSLLAAYPTEVYIKQQLLEEWMIYRFVVCHLLGSFGLMLLLATALIAEIGHYGPRRRSSTGFWPALLTALFRGPVLATMAAAFILAAVFFLWPGIVEYATTGHITLHWSRLLAGSFSLFSAFQTVVFALLIKVVSIWKRQQAIPEAEREYDPHGPGDACVGFPLSEAEREYDPV
jgi:glycosyltransferase involved in cell wall biosynthesis